MMIHRPDWADDKNLSWLDYSAEGQISSDASEVAFSEEGMGTGADYELCLRRTDGSPVVRLGDGAPLDLSPDGNWVLAEVPAPPPRIVLQPTGAGESRRIDGGGLEHVYYARFIHGGDSLWITGKQRGQKAKVYVQGRDGGPVMPLANDLPGGVVGLSADGTRILCRRGD
jgi:hypothetical protein